MKITELQECLEKMKTRVGDLDVKIEEYESGEMMPVVAAFHFTTGGAGDDYIELCTKSQCEDFPEDQTIVLRG